MFLTERHYTKGTPEIIYYCKLSKELYNKANYYMRTHYFKTNNVMSICELYKYVNYLDCYLDFKNTKTAKAILRKLIFDWKNYIKASKAYEIYPENFTSQPKPPKYKKKLNQVIFYNETIKRGKSKISDVITPTNNLFSIKSGKKYKQVIITPKTFGFMIDVYYEKQEEIKERPNDCAIDLGMNNLATITSNQHLPKLVNGRILKSINQLYNKGKKRKKDSRKRYFRIENYFHHTSKYIVQNCVKHDIGHIIIGKNLGWKCGLNLGKITNQNFQYISFNSLLQKIEYKAKLLGIKVTLTEEAYTSKASFFDKDPIPKYDKTLKLNFSGKRVKRGLYRTSDGFEFNADVNGSLNIGRKVIPNFYEKGDRGACRNPMKINPLTVFNTVD